MYNFLKNSLFFLVMGSFSIVDASYVQVLIRINKEINNENQKIPGVGVKEVIPNQVIPYYIGRLRDYINTQCIGTDNILTQTIQILDEYEQYSDQEYPVGQFHYHNTDAQVEYFFKRVCHSIPSLYYPPTVTFFCFDFIKKYEEINDQLSQLNSIYQKKYTDLEQKYNKNNATQINLLTIQLAEIKAEKEKAIEEYNKLKQLNNTELKEDKDAKLELSQLSTQIKQKDAQIEKLTTKNAQQNAALKSVFCKNVSEHLTKNQQKSSFSYVTAILLISNLYFAYKYYTK